MRINYENKKKMFKCLFMFYLSTNRYLTILEILFRLLIMTYELKKTYIISLNTNYLYKYQISTLYLIWQLMIFNGIKKKWVFWYSHSFPKNLISLQVHAT